VCLRLYSKEQFESWPVFTTPEILRTSLASGNVIDVYFDSVAQGTYEAGFFTTLSAGDLLTAVQNATWHVWGKDASGFFPGHGGMFDRIDSVLFTAPFVYYYAGALLGTAG
jgi:HrpA-like RNA helicase